MALDRLKAFLGDAPLPTTDAVRQVLVAWLADLKTVRGTLARAAEMARALALRLWMPLAVAAALIGIGIWLIIANNSTAQVAARLTPVPQRDYVAGFQQPQSRWRRAWHELRTGAPQAVASAPVTPDPSQPDPATA